jgi:hypothetical protein
MQYIATAGVLDVHRNIYVAYGRRDFLMKSKSLMESRKTLILSYRWAATGLFSPLLWVCVSPIRRRKPGPTAVLGGKKYQPAALVESWVVSDQTYPEDSQVSTAPAPTPMSHYVYVQGAPTPRRWEIQQAQGGLWDESTEVNEYYTHRCFPPSRVLHLQTRWQKWKE